jgi:hypothetical protein
MKKIMLWIIIIITTLLLANCTGKTFNKIEWRMGGDLIELYELGVFTLDEFNQAIDLLKIKYPYMDIDSHVQKGIKNSSLFIHIMPKTDTIFYCRMFVSLEDDVYFKGNLVLWRLKKNNDLEWITLCDLTFREERAIEREFETEILPKIKECLEIVKNQRKKRWKLE